MANGKFKFEISYSTKFIESRFNLGNLISNSNLNLYNWWDFTFSAVTVFKSIRRLACLVRNLTFDFETKTFELV